MCYCFPEKMVMNLDVSLHKTIVIITNLQIRKSLLLCQVSECRQAVSRAVRCAGWPSRSCLAWPGHMTYPDQSEAGTNQATNQKPVMRPLQIYKFKMNGLIACCLNSPFCQHQIYSKVSILGGTTCRQVRWT